MLPIPPQPVAVADATDADAVVSGGEMERFGEATEFINWAGRGAADLILPKME